MKTPEQIRMESFYNVNFPTEIISCLNWELDKNGQYLIGFARLAWAAWQEAQRGDEDL